MIARVTPATRRFLTHRGAVVGAVLVAVMIALAVLGPLVASHDPIARDIDHGLSALGAPLARRATALLGTDQLGRDVLGAGAGGRRRPRSQIATLATIARRSSIGLSLGLVAGYAGGRTDNALMRLVDLVLAFPFLLLAILLAALLRESDLGASTAPVVLTLGLVGWTTMARVIRGKALSLARSEYVTAARALGASPLRIVVHHVLPNVAGHRDRRRRRSGSRRTSSPRRRCRTSGSARRRRRRRGAACCTRAARTTGPRRGCDRARHRDPDRRRRVQPARRGAARRLRSEGARDETRARAHRVLGLAAACNSSMRGPQYRAAGNATPRDGGTLRIATKDRDPHARSDDRVRRDLDDRAPPAVRDARRLRRREHDDARARTLAERWEISPDGLVVSRSSLRAGITYSDGTPIVAGRLQVQPRARARRPRTRRSARSSPTSPDERCVADDAPHRSRITARTRRRNAAFLYVLTMPFTTPQRADHVARTGDQLRREPLGSGPFVLASWDEGERIVLRKNPRYWDAGARPPRRHRDARERPARHAVPDVRARRARHRRARSRRPTTCGCVEQPAWQPYVHRRALMNAYGSRMNVRRKPFDDRRVRQALNYALDKAHTSSCSTAPRCRRTACCRPACSAATTRSRPTRTIRRRRARCSPRPAIPHGFDVDYVIIERRGGREARGVAAGGPRRGRRARAHHADVARDVRHRDRQARRPAVLV